MTEPPSPQGVGAGSPAASPAPKKGEEDEEEASCSAKVVMVTLAMPSQFRHTEPDFNENIDCTPRIFILKNGKSKLTDFFPPAGYFVAGGISGVVSRTVTAPLDRLKVYLIASTEARKPNLKGGPIQALKGSTGVLVDACRILWKTGGIRSLYAGNGLNVVKVMPESAIKFGSYEAAKRFMARVEGSGDIHNISSFSKFIAGGLGGMFSQLCIYPLDTLKFRMQCNVTEKGSRGNKLIIETARKMFKEGVVRSSYRGLTMGLCGMFPYSALDLGTFELCKKTLIAYNAKAAGLPIDHPDVQPGNFASGAMGAFSGALGASVVYPVNLLRTRLQAQGTDLHPHTYTGVVDCWKKCVSQEGYRGLFKGLAPNLLKVIPAVSITYVCYEHSKKVMNLR